MPTRQKPSSATSQVLAALVATPAPLKSTKENDAFRDLLDSIQDLSPKNVTNKFATDASAELIRIVNATVAPGKGRAFKSELLFALKILAMLGTRKGTDTIVKIAKSGHDADSYMWSTVLGPFGEGHPHAAPLFAALSKPLPQKFLAVCLLDAANAAAREHGLKKHPFDSPAGAKALAAYLSSPLEEEDSYAVSACAALPFISKSRRAPLITLAREHTDPSIRMEVAWATAHMGDKTGLAHLVEKCLDPNESMTARHYLKELGRKKLIPRAALDPDFTALAEMCEWLSHPNEYGEPPSSIELMDKRTIYWPPTSDTREVRLFKFKYLKNEYRDKNEVGVGMVGSTTWAFFDTTKPTMKPEDIYGLHCCFELDSDDPRAPKKPSAKAGWALIQAGK